MTDTSDTTPDPQAPLSEWEMTARPEPSSAPSYGTYLRLDITVHDGWRAVVRAAARRLKPHARRDPSLRDERHRFHRQMLAYHHQAWKIVRTWRL